MKSNLLKGSLLLGSVFLLTACAPAEEEKNSEEATTVVEETTVADTTEAEEATTVAEEDTTEAEEDTTEAEEDTTEAEEDTTEAEEDTTEAEEDTTEAEEDTTEAEEDTTEAEEDTTEAEEDTTEAEEDTTEAEEDTTEAEEDITEAEDAAVPVAGEEAGELQDGDYKVISNEDDHGWAVDHAIVVKDGKITESTFDYLNAEGKKKSEDEEYNKNMKEQSGVSNNEAVEKLNSAFLEGQTPDVDVVSGATSTSETFKLTSQVLLKMAEQGHTEEVNVDELPLQDGGYSIQGEADEHGWTPEMSIVVSEGKISEVNFDYKNAEGKLKSEDEEYNKSMEEKSGISNNEAVEQLVKSLVDNQDVAKVDVVSGATSTSETFTSMANQLLQMAKLENLTFGEAEGEDSSESEAEETTVAEEETSDAEEETTEAEEKSEETSEEDEEESSQEETTEA